MKERTAHLLLAINTLLIAVVIVRCETNIARTRRAENHLASVLKTMINMENDRTNEINAMIKMQQIDAKKEQSVALAMFQMQSMLYDFNCVFSSTTSDLLLYQKYMWANDQKAADALEKTFIKSKQEYWDMCDKASKSLADLKLKMTK